MNKYYKLYQNSSSGINNEQMNSLIEVYHQKLSKTKKRFLTKTGSKYRSIPIEDIACFIKEDLTYLIKWDGSRFILDEPLSDIETQIPKSDFFRLNRQCLAHINIIDELISYSRSRLKVKLKLAEYPEAFVSQATATSLKNWLDQ
jgi:DNA-binding LytR/AlgR family response regulator